jgi:hypothetical protein
MPSRITLCIMSIMGATTHFFCISTVHQLVLCTVSYAVITVFMNRRQFLAARSLGPRRRGMARHMAHAAAVLWQHLLTVSYTMVNSSRGGWYELQHFFLSSRIGMSK